MADDDLSDDPLVPAGAHFGDEDLSAPPDAEDDTGEGLLDRLRGTGVGVEDPNIVGDVGPTDVPPGRDSPGDGLLADDPIPE